MLKKTKRIYYGTAVLNITNLNAFIHSLNKYFLKLSYLQGHSSEQIQRQSPHFHGIILEGKPLSLRSLPQPFSLPYKVTQPVKTSPVESCETPYCPTVFPFLSVLLFFLPGIPLYFLTCCQYPAFAFSSCSKVTLLRKSSLM